VNKGWNCTSKGVVLSLLLSVFLSSCSLLGSGETVREVVGGGLSPKELNELAKGMLDFGRSAQAIDNYRTIIAAFPKSKYAINARVQIAYISYKTEKYQQAFKEIDKFVERYPNSETTPYLYYLRCTIIEEQAKSSLDGLLTERAQREVQSLQKAQSCYTNLADQFPSSPYAKDAKTKLSEINNTVARHEFIVALYYTNNNSHIAAVNRCKYIIENYSGTDSIADALHLMAENYDAMGIEQLAVDARSVFALNFPEYEAEYD